MIQSDTKLSEDAIYSGVNPCGVAHSRTVYEASDRVSVADRIVVFGGSMELVRFPVSLQHRDAVDLDHLLWMKKSPDFHPGACRRVVAVYATEQVGQLDEFRHVRRVDRLRNEIPERRAFRGQTTLHDLQGPFDLGPQVPHAHNLKILEAALKRRDARQIKGVSGPDRLGKGVRCENLFIQVSDSGIAS